ncbi:hypothetical protein DFJ73DRAFT_246780 [Zopfochytrium polystomum]|nr:hypothetical protein DFJ73DRAFT_246780 [Zopfochytrium polystomum]
MEHDFHRSGYPLESVRYNSRDVGVTAAGTVVAAESSTIRLATADRVISFQPDLDMYRRVSTAVQSTRSHAKESDSLSSRFMNLDLIGAIEERFQWPSNSRCPSRQRSCLTSPCSSSPNSPSTGPRRRRQQPANDSSTVVSKSSTLPSWLPPASASVRGATAVVTSPRLTRSSGASQDLHTGSSRSLEGFEMPRISPAGPHSNTQSLTQSPITTVEGRPRVVIVDAAQRLRTQSDVPATAPEPRNPRRSQQRSRASSFANSSTDSSSKQWTLKEQRRQTNSGAPSPAVFVQHPQSGSVLPIEQLTPDTSVQLSSTHLLLPPFNPTEPPPSIDQLQPVAPSTPPHNPFRRPRHSRRKLHLSGDDIAVDTVAEGEKVADGKTSLPMDDDQFENEWLRITGEVDQMWLQNLTALFSNPSESTTLAEGLSTQDNFAAPSSNRSSTSSVSGNSDSSASITSYSKLKQLVEEEEASFRANLVSLDALRQRQVDDRREAHQRELEAIEARRAFEAAQAAAREARQSILLDIKSMAEKVQREREEKAAAALQAAAEEQRRQAVREDEISEAEVASRSVTANAEKQSRRPKAQRSGGKGGRRRPSVIGLATK